VHWQITAIQYTAIISLTIGLSISNFENASMYEQNGTNAISKFEQHLMNEQNVRYAVAYMLNQ
jgi:hypothetical protein